VDKQAVEDSLRRLGTDYVDLYQMHRPDHETDIDETLSVLSDLIRSGKVRAIGSSFFSPEQTLEAQWAAARGGHHRLRTEQPTYSILTRGIESSVLPTASKNLTVLAREAGVPLSHLAVAFVLTHPAITSVLIGPRTPEHLVDLLAGAEVKLSEDVLDLIDEIVPPGVDLNDGDFYIDPAPAIADKRLRRR
jgi:aryl-alcohol dehydrogenase-like predicted oxidoreductase